MYRESMAAPDTKGRGSSDVRAERLRQWCRALLALSILFASMPLMSKLVLGSWGFDDAPGIGFLFFAAAVYLHFAGRKHRQTPDPAAMLDAAIHEAAEGHIDKGLAILDEALRLSPRLWQARQYRGEMELGVSNTAESALQDFSEAIRLAPSEPHLYLLRSHVFGLLGRDGDAQADLEAAARLGEDDASERAPQVE